ncbi:hypothetical protein DFH06DRAFT_1294272 [Mycena polygramma]|nr:hypothetical protein DFH06DRAFT_1294272 [Mycena polygramma]
MCIRKGAGNQHRIRTQHFIDSNKFATQQQQHTYLETNHHPCFRTTTIPAPPALEICAKTTYQRPANRAPWMNIFAAGRQIPPATAMQRSTHLHLGCGAAQRRQHRRDHISASRKRVFNVIFWPPAGKSHLRPQCNVAHTCIWVVPPLRSANVVETISRVSQCGKPSLRPQCSVAHVPSAREGAAQWRRHRRKPYIGFPPAGFQYSFFSAAAAAGLELNCAVRRRGGRSTTYRRPASENIIDPRVHHRPKTKIRFLGVPRAAIRRTCSATVELGCNCIIFWPKLRREGERVRVGVESYVVPLYMWIFLRAAGAVFNRLDFKSAPAERSFHVLSQISTPFKQDLRLHFRISSAISSDSDGRLQILTLELVSLASKTQKLTLEVDKSVNKNSSRDKRSVRVPEEFKEHNEEGQGGRE